MRAIVTGAAGFIGSHLAERLVSQGYEVIGIDCFSDYYPRWIKKNNINKLLQKDNFSLLEQNLLDLNLQEILKSGDYIFHQAAQAGVRSSWGDDFAIYSRSNILATQQLLEASKKVGVEKFIYASSSSVYGAAYSIPMCEDDKTRPVSPYGVSKLAGENLCQLYNHNFDLPTISLRYFTVFGERQRPDMAFHIFIRNIFQNKEIKIFGDGKQSRNFTYVGDVVEANLLAAESQAAGEIINVGGPSERITLLTAIETIEEILGVKAERNYQSQVNGDVLHTEADLSKAKNLLGYEPEVSLNKGLECEIEYIEKLYDF